MHIPDGYLGPKTFIPLWTASIALWILSFKKIRKKAGTEALALTGIFAAFSFVVQMFNIPLPGGTTAHIIGAGATAIVLGPYLSYIAISVVLVLQAILFADGGITAIGANAFNMGFLFAFISWGIFSLFKNLSERWKIIGAFLAGYAGICASAIATAIELGIQPILETSDAGNPLYSPFPLKIAIPAMMVPHILVIGIIEGIFTVLVVKYFKKNFPELLK
ncbi:MAG TPA: cobalt transporter CbiM [bacterium]